MGALHRKLPHASVSVPCFASRGSIAMVNFSTGLVTLSACSGARPRSWARLYSVPHCPVCLLTMRSTPRRCGAVHSVYVPAASSSPASVIGTEVVNWVAALAPVRQMRS
jgi:hypothetical protein